MHNASDWCAFYLLLLKFPLLLLIYYNNSCVNGYPPRLSEQQIKFDSDYGGLHTWSAIYPIRFGTFFKTPEENDCIINNYTGCFDVMLSTIHPRTFLLDGRTGKCDDEEHDYNNATVRNNFCKTHPKRFNPDQSLTIHDRSGEPIPIINPLDGNEIGIRVEDSLIMDYDLKMYYQKFEIMNHRAATLPDYWGIESADKNNLADGCLSLMAGELPEQDPDSFDAKKPVQRFVNYGMIKSIVTIHLRFIWDDDEIWKNGQTLLGQITFGGLSSSLSCNGWHWHFLEKDQEKIGATSSGAYWSFKMDSIEGIENATKQNAIIDTTTQIIGVPWEHWDEIQNYFFDNKTILITSSENDTLPRFNCADLNKLKKMRAFRFSTNNLWYTIPPIALIKQFENDECQLLIGKNAEQDDQRWHFGVPFLRSHCVAKDFFPHGRMWFSGGVHIEDLPKSNNATATLPFDWMIWMLSMSTIIALNFSLTYISKFLN